MVLLELSTGWVVREIHHTSITQELYEPGLIAPQTQMSLSNVEFLTSELGGKIAGNQRQRPDLELR